MQPGGNGCADIRPAIETASPTDRGGPAPYLAVAGASLFLRCLLALQSDVARLPRKRRLCGSGRFLSIGPRQ